MITSCKRALLISVVLVLSLPVLAMADPPSLVGRLNLVEGGVSFRPGSLDEWAPAVLNYPLTAGDHLWADQGGRAELHVGSTAIRLDAGTEISFLNLDDQTVQLGVSEGQLNVRLRRLDPGDAFEIDTPNAVVTVQQPGSYTIAVHGEEGTSVTAWQGMAEVTAAGNDFTVPEGQSASVSGSGSIAWYLQPAAGPDAWDAWCASRDNREERFASARYVPREMIGAEDLDDNGSWIVMAGYGPVWQPLRVAPGWAPYKFGRWAWVAPWGWTWIDDAPWGFAPFHYGRWAFLGARWVWIPGDLVERPVYAPALVVFIGGGPGDPSADGIGWFPLGPREVYVPPYGASPRYVQRINVTTVNVSEQSIEGIDVRRGTYVNRDVPSGVTVVPRGQFGQGRPAGGPVISFSTEQQVRRAPIMGMGATIAPQRESVIGGPFVARNPPPQPPPQVAGRSVFGRIVPAPAPAPFMVRSEPLPPPTMYQRPPQQVQPQPQGPIRQAAPMRIDPMGRGPGFAVPPRENPQAPGPVMQAPPQHQPAPVMQPQRPGAPQPIFVQPQQQPRGPVMQGPADRQPGPVMQPQRQQPPAMQQQAPILQQQQPPGMQQQPPVLQQIGPQQPPPRGPVMQAPPQQAAPQRVAVQPQRPPQQLTAPPQPGVKPQPAPQQGDRSGSGDKGKGEAQNLLNSLKLKNLPDVQGHLESARKQPGAKLDYAGISRQLDSARSAWPPRRGPFPPENPMRPLRRRRQFSGSWPTWTARSPRRRGNAAGGTGARCFRWTQLRAASRTSLIFSRSTSESIGFSMRTVPERRISCWTMMSFV